MNCYYIVNYLAKKDIFQIVYQLYSDSITAYDFLDKFNESHNKRYILVEVIK